MAALIRDGDCLQTGIGAIPAAILNQLDGKNDLGMHGGLIDDGSMRLIENGNLTGARKALDTHKHVTGMALGSAELMAWLARRRDVVFRGANHTHEVSAIRQLDGFVSVNSAVEVDLFGQVNAEMAGGRQISGTGGSVDFMRAAKSVQGRQIHCGHERHRPGRQCVAHRAQGGNGDCVAYGRRYGGHRVRGGANQRLAESGTGRSINRDRRTAVSR